MIATGINLSKKEVCTFEKTIGKFSLCGEQIPTSMGLVHYDLNSEFFVIPMLSCTSPNPNALNLYERYANEELIFEWRDFNSHQAILEFLGVGGDYFSLTGCTYLKLKAKLLYQIESYFWDIDMSDWSDELYQSYVIKPIEIMGIKSEFIKSIKDEDIAYILNLLDLQIAQTPRLFEIHNKNAPTFLYGIDGERIENEKDLL